MIPDLRRQLKPAGDKGFILVAVLWAAVLLALLAAGFAASVRGHVRATASALELARAEALADGGVNLALMDLVTARQNPKFASRFPIGGNASAGLGAACVAASGTVLIVRIEDEAGKVNLNLADDRLLSVFFAGLGASAEQAAEYTDRVLDFRDGDNDTRPHGAELTDYVAGGSNISPKNGALDTVDELDQVLGLAPELTARAKTFATVHSGLAGIDGSVASSGLVAIFDAAALQSATGGLTSQAAAFGDAQFPARLSARSNQRAYTIHALARMVSGVQYVSQAIVEFPVRSELGYVLHQWRRGSVGDADRLESVNEVDVPPC